MIVPTLPRSAAFDLAILGSGFGGSLLAMIGRRLGLTVLLLERGSHPRFAIGESTSPLTNLLLEEVAREFDLPRLLPFGSYGAWKRAYPEVTVGLKRGFTYYQHEAGNRFTPREDRSNELLVAASPNDEVADTHWYRADFDHFLVREAVNLGVEYVDHVRIDHYRREGERTTLEGRREGRAVQYHARYVIDATGPRGALSRLLSLPEALPRDGYPNTQAVFTHFSGVPRFSDTHSLPEGSPPYPPDDAALHHVFDGGWVWVLRFENGITSAGFAVRDWLARELGAAEGAPAWERLLLRFPGVAEHFAGSEAVLPFVHVPRLPYRCGVVAGEGFALLPSAAGFVDPFFSTGFPLTLLGILRLGRGMRDHGIPLPWGNDSLYARLTVAELADSATLVEGCYALFPRFRDFAALSMVYFTAASYAEMARRLNRLHLADRFLLGNREAFRAALYRHCGAALAGPPSPSAAIAADLEPFNIAGLSDPARWNWYGVDLEDVVRGAEKLECTPEEVRAYFRRMGWGSFSVPAGAGETRPIP